MTEPERDPDDTRDQLDTYEAGDTGAEAPDADAAEQARPVVEEARQEPSIGPEVDEYDAVEQSRVVEDEDEYRS